MNILVTGVGAIIGYGIINSLRRIEDLDIYIVGMDIYHDAYGQFICDKFYIAERADSDCYLTFLNTLIEKEQIDLIIPGIEQDMYRMNDLKDHIKCKVVLNNELLISISKDKLQTFEYMQSHTELNLIPTLFNVSYEKCVTQLGSPFLLKPRQSYASKGIHKIYSLKDFEYYNSQQDNNIFQRIVGSMETEYTISIFGDGRGEYWDYIILKRKLAQSGATDKAEVILEDSAIMNYVSDLCKILRPVGPTNIQLRREGEQLYLLEINPRISSSCSIRTSAGYNEPFMCLCYYLGVRKYFPNEKKFIKSVRYIDDYIYR